LKWTKIKNIILGFLLIMNIFMLLIIAITSGQKMTVPKEVINSSVSFLKNSGFTIDEKQIPGKYYTLHSYNATFYSASDLSELFFKKQVPFRTTGNSLVAVYENAVLTVKDNNFIYENNSEEAASNPTEIKKALEKTGIDMSGAVYDNNDNYFYCMYDDANLFNMSIRAKLDKSGNLCYVSAYWPKELNSGEKHRISFVESIMKIKEEFPNGGTIKAIELGYSLSSIGGEKFIFEPTWRIMVDDELKILE